jgi:NAD dependent epimerase/dehydratase family enzyme
LLGDLSSELLGSKRVIPTVAERNGFAFRYPELTPALEDLLG